VVLVVGAFGVERRRVVGPVVVANLVTHPLLWFVVAPWLQDRSGLAGLALAEAAVVVAEGQCYNKRFASTVGRWLPWWTSLLANSVSFGLGVALRS
jgi:hypothetical protein